MSRSKQWLCENGHVLGFIHWNGNDVPQLMLLRHAVDLSTDDPAQVDLMVGPLVGKMPVQCDICEDVKPWDITVDAMVELILSLSDEEMMRLQERVMRKQNRLKVKAVFE